MQEEKSVVIENCELECRKNVKTNDSFLASLDYQPCSARNSMYQLFFETKNPLRPESVIYYLDGRISVVVTERHDFEYIADSTLGNTFSEKEHFRKIKILMQKVEWIVFFIKKFSTSVILCVQNVMKEVKPVAIEEKTASLKHSLLIAQFRIFGLSEF